MEAAGWRDAGDAGRLNSGSEWESGKSMIITGPGGERSSISSSENDADTIGSGRKGDGSLGDRRGVEPLENEAVGTEAAFGLGVEPEWSPGFDDSIGSRDGVGADNGRSGSE